MVTPPTIAALPLHVHSHAPRGIHQQRIVSSVSSLGGVSPVLQDQDGGEVTASIQLGSSTRRKVVVQRMDGDTVASFDLPPNPSSNESCPGRWTHSNPQLCWANFKARSETEGPKRKMLCVLGNPTTLLVFDVLGDASSLTTSSSQLDDGESMIGPNGHTIPLPFRAQSIFATETGLLITRIPSDEDYYQDRIGLDGRGDNDLVDPPPSPVGLSLPATPRSIRQKADEEELSLDDPPDPVRMNYNVQVSDVPCIFTICHPLDEIRPLAVGVGEASSQPIGGQLSLFSDINETLVSVHTPRLFHGTPGSPTPICVTFNETTRCHTFWSLRPVISPIQTLPLWRTTGRGAWRDVRDAGKDEPRNQVDEAKIGGAMQSEPKETLNTSVDSAEDIAPLGNILHTSVDDASMDRGSNISNLDQNEGLHSSFSDIHPDYTISRLYTEEGATYPADDSNGCRCSFLATTVEGKGDTLLCLFGPNSSDGGTGNVSRSDDEPALLRCYSLHIGDAGIDSIRHFADITCKSAMPVQVIPTPLAPFSLEREGCRRKGRLQNEDCCAMATDILVIRQRESEPTLGLYRAGVVHVTNFAIPLDVLHSLAMVDLANSVDDRVDIEYIRDLKATTVRVSLSLIVKSSPITETAIRTIESSLVHNSSPSWDALPCSLDMIHRQEFSHSWLGVTLPLLIRSDCIASYQRNSASFSNSVEDPVWQVLTSVVSDLLLGEQISQTGTQPKKYSAWEELLQSEFHQAFCQGEGEYLFDDADGLGFSTPPSASETATVGGSTFTCVEVVSKTKPDEHRVLKELIFDALHMLHGEQTNFYRRCHPPQYLMHS